MDYKEKDPQEEVTFADLKEAHEDLASEFRSQFSEWKGKVDKYVDENGELPADIEEQFDRLNDRLDELETIKSRRLEKFEEQKKANEPSPEAKAYDEFLRKGERGVSHETLETLENVKTLSTDNDADGGYLVPVQIRDEIIEKRRATSPVRQYATVLTISSGDSLKIPKEDDTDFDAGWTGERESRPETDHAGFEMLTIPTHEMYAKPLATQQMLDDPEFDIEAWIEDKVSDKFSRKEGTAFVTGDGHQKPEGLLEASGVSEVNSGDNSSLTYQGLLDLVYDIEIDEYVRNAIMMLNRKTVGTIRGFTDDQNMPIWSPGLSESDPPNILGFEYVTATDMPTVSSNAEPILFGDLSIAYYIVDRQAIRFLRDPFSSKPHVEFYYTTRVGGQVVQEDALRKQVVSA